MKLPGLKSESLQTVVGPVSQTFASVYTCHRVSRLIDHDTGKRNRIRRAISAENRLSAVHLRLKSFHWATKEVYSSWPLENKEALLQGKTGQVGSAI